MTTAPESPGVPRGVALTMLGSVPTALGWYGYYKFSVEEELFQDELRREGRVSGRGFVRDSVWAFNLAPAFPRGALTLCPQLCMGILPRR